MQGKHQTNLNYHADILASTIAVATISKLKGLDGFSFVLYLKGYPVLQLFRISVSSYRAHGDVGPFRTTVCDGILLELQRSSADSGRTILASELFLAM